MNKNVEIQFEENKLIKSSFRPFISKWLYYDNKLISRIYSFENIFKKNKQNKFISLRCISSDDELTCLSSSTISDLGFLKTGNGGTFSCSLYYYSVNGENIENITDWALQQFNEHYDAPQPSDASKAPDGYSNSKTIITKEDIFHYVYAVLHHPAYRKKYELNLKREFPRIPFYDNFPQWAKWGEQLMNLHINYETVQPYALQVSDASKASDTSAEKLNKPKLKADKINGTIELDAITTLTGIPKAAWEYKLGNRSALEWVLDQYKEKKPGDPTIAEKFNTYKFAGYKEHVTDLLKRVCTVSVETMNIIAQMPGE